MKKSVAIVVPVYNEEESVSLFFNETTKATSSLNDKYKFDFIFVDDGSTDKTLEDIKNIKAKNIHYISFSKNFGKEAAIFAGLKSSVKYDFTILMDVDLQDPPKLIPEMFALLEEKSLDSVGTKRINRKGEKSFVSFFSNVFYKLISKMSQTKIESGSRDFRLMKKTMVEAIVSMPEYQRFTKGIFSWVGFNSEYIGFENENRKAGTTKWNFWKLTKYAIDGIVSFSTFPLTIVTFLGIFSMFISIVGGIAVIIRRLLGVYSQFGWASTVAIILFFAGLQMLSLGIVGKYIANIYIETKHRPIYIEKESK